MNWGQTSDNMKTIHKIIFGNANSMAEIGDNSVDLMVTSPPYPMIKMWDEIFSNQNSAIGFALRNGKGEKAFELMHKELDKVWEEVYRVLKKGGFACINIGDTTRTIKGKFRLYSNHSRILHHCLKVGFNPLPEILWRKQTNAPNKFMGSGMLAAGAYVTLEHEYILVLRKGDKREFKSKEEKLRRQGSAFFWEERNLWFSDIWEDLKGTKQNNVDKKVRERSGAYPFELPYRIINMFSLRQDTILDPFLGTGTTMVASMITGRNSVGIEIDPNFRQQLHSRVNGTTEFSNKILENRILNHLKFVKERTEAKKELRYNSKFYDFQVMTNQETEILFDKMSKITGKDDIFEVEYKETPTFKSS